MPGKKYRSIKRPRVYEALKRKGYSKKMAAKIANAGKKANRRGGRKSGKKGR
ncbi:hypothetical protein SEA_HUPHLEPUFF_23 [Mycobacterium phage Huphlepuff]|uniref:Uncharacterized protein n=3 Tax=Marvinvirus mosmoris TaxID=1982093 RepID=A0A3S9U8Z1_9CAUD|nr:hypothetical protein FH33_gp020 [Mycobacterium phage MosMoris]AHY84094.1 hypothetical protein PBI_MOSMORIS_20 [Mycobacterium phage MosMoris]ANM46244.1 hypothetical protein SEA_GATTACA_21 [Mycobacterium phage Gattaca]AZS06786.1 hypothetical protein SEA_RAELA_22 [Mycobacterium phage Raela]URP22514.1 hypothetical protein SEA_HUPHLEPUFF_23 [Mycobacterium phage Huphlepuff]